MARSRSDLTKTTTGEEVHAAPPSEEGRRRVVIEGVQPEIDRGRFPIKRTTGEKVVVEADIFTDGHDELSCRLLYRREQEPGWVEVAMEPLGNDRWRGLFPVMELGWHRYTVEAWVDRFRSWRRDLQKRVHGGQDGQDLSVHLLEGAAMVDEAGRRATGAVAQQLRATAALLRQESDGDLSRRLQAALDEELAHLMTTLPDRRLATRYDRELRVVVEREKARFSSWYELFPRSTSPDQGAHGTLKDCEARLPYVASLGFDVLYLPPIHPIGYSQRKGKNNAPAAKSEDPGSPWAIGSLEGGHKSVHPLLGSLKDFRHLVAAAKEHGLEIALDLAFQTSPDHPYAREHPEWYRRRPDGTIQFAENPPKKYEDIYPFDFETEHWPELWQELKSVTLFWIEQGVHIFRVDNPHTKPFAFWEWLIAEVQSEHPDVIFLSEAFTRPKVMYRLAKLGFSQSYSYFAWRNTKYEIVQYLTGVTQPPVSEYFRPNLWPNTPDILTEYLQYGGRSAFMARLVLAATLSANYGIYGPAFEMMENQPREPGSEEYLNSEKYEIRHWDLERASNFREFVTRVNRIRRESLALQSNVSLRFHSVENDQIVCYSKSTEDGSEVLVMVVNLDPYHVQAGWVELPVETFGLASHQPYQLHDLLSEARYLWYGNHGYVQLDPHSVPAHIFRLRRRVRTEHDFEYYM